MAHRKPWMISVLALPLLVVGAAGIASGQLASRPAEEWIPRLERPERIAELEIDQVIARLDLKPGDIVADLGAGSGVFAYPFARAVAPNGKVLAVEIDPDFLAHIERRARDQNIDNIELVLGRFEDPALPRQVDVGFFHDVLHHIEDRAAYLRNLATYVKPEGRIAIIELDAAHPETPHRDQPELQVTKEEVRRWMANAGFQPVQEHELFDRKWFIVYARDGAATSK